MDIIGTDLMCKKRTKVAFLVLLHLFFLLPALVFSQTSGYKIKTVVIDPGHGGRDPGAVCAQGYEKDIALNVSLKLGHLIDSLIPGVKVIYTRDKDEYLELHKRAKIANDNKADLFICVHVNANKSSKPIGSETYVMGLHVSDENLSVAKLENSVILEEEDYHDNYEGFDPNSSEGYIVFSLMQNAHLDNSLIFASKVQDQFRERAKRIDRGVKQAGFLVLWKTTMPSVLVEMGFISNPDEAAFLLTDNGQDIIASSIYRAFKEYKNLIEANSAIGNSNNEDNYSNTEEGIRFKIQIAVSDIKIKDTQSTFKGIAELSEVKFGEMYKYFAGSFTSYDEAVRYQEDIKTSYPDAFMVAFRNGEKISVKDALNQ